VLPPAAAAGTGVVAPVGGVPPTHPGSGPVLGLRLGQRLNLPACPIDARGDQELQQSLRSRDAAPFRFEASCRFTPDALEGRSRLFAQRLANVTADPLPPRVDFALVAVATDQCPDWVLAAGSCIAGVTLQNDRIIGVSFLTGDASRQNDIARSLSQQYASGPSVQGAPVCQDPTLGAVLSVKHVWEQAGLRVTYFPAGGFTCQQGRVLVETSAMNTIVAPSASVVP